MEERLLIRKLQKAEEFVNTALNSFKNFEQSFDESLEIKSKMNRDLTKEEEDILNRIFSKTRELALIIEC